MPGHAYRFSQDAARALLEALHLENHKVRRIELVFDVDQPVTLTVYEYAQHEHHADVCRVLTLGEWHAQDEAESTDTAPVRESGERTSQQPGGGGI